MTSQDLEEKKNKNTANYQTKKKSMTWSVTSLATHTYIHAYLVQKVRLIMSPQLPCLASKQYSRRMGGVVC